MRLSRICLRWIAAIALGGAGWGSAGCALLSASDSQPAATADQPPIRWITYNVASFNGWHRRLEDLERQLSRAREMGRLMRTWDATVIGLQEVPRDVRVQAALAEGLGAGWEIAPLPINASADKPRTVAVAWRSDRVKWGAAVETQAGWPQYWGAVDLWVDGRKWRVHTGKLSPGKDEAAAERRSGEVDRLLPALDADRVEAESRVVLLADFNTHDSDPLWDRWWAADWKDAALGTAADAIPTKNDRGETTYWRRLDYVLLPVELSGRVRRGEVLDAGQLRWRGESEPEPWSDHLPVLIDWALGN
jgi:endonuclease/exonuclease/phosphatase family metal-dependent hydrolase